MRKNQLFIYVCLLFMLLGSACTEDIVTDYTNRQITVYATMPGAGMNDGTGSMANGPRRVALRQNEGSLDLIARWTENDVIHLFVIQEEKCYALEDSKVSNISSDGKSCSFTIQLPSTVDPGCPYEVIGLCGAEGMVFDNTVAAAKCPLKRVFWKDGMDTTAPIWFRCAGNDAGIRATFKHLGTYEVLHIKNSTASSIDFKLWGFDAPYPWYKVEINYNLDDDFNPLLYVIEPGDVESDIGNIAAGATGKILSWYIPTGMEMKDAILQAFINGKPVSSTNTKSSNVQILQGHAYHMYATWDGKELKFDGEEPSEQDPVEVIQVDVTKANYYPNHFSHNGKQYSFRYYCTAFVKLNDDTNIQDWGYVYVDPDGNESELISLMPYKSDVGIVGDNRFSYYRDECSSTVKLKGYVKCYGDSEIYYGKEQEFQINYPDETSIAINSCTFQGTTNNVSYLGRTYKYKSTFRYIFSATGAYWMKVGTQVDGPGWSNWTDLPNQTISPVDGSKANALTVNYYYDDKTFTGDYYVFLIATDDTHARSSRTAEYVGYTYSANQFTGCILYGTQNSRLTPVCDIVEGGQSQDNEEPVSDYIINIVSNK